LYSIFKHFINTLKKNNSKILNTNEYWNGYKTAIIINNLWSSLGILRELNLGIQNWKKIMSEDLYVRPILIRLINDNKSIG